MFILIDVLLVVLSSFAMPLGYIIGIYTEKEIRHLAETAKMHAIFSFPMIIVEIFVLSLLPRAVPVTYATLLGVVMLANMVMSALKSSTDYDLVRTTEYQLLYLSGNLVVLMVVFLI